jgi:hypothetical protein
MIKLTEAKRLIGRWGKGSFKKRKLNIKSHVVTRGSLDTWRYLRKAYNFNKTGASSSGVRFDGSIFYKRQNGEFLIERDGKIVTYGQNNIHR